MKATKCSTPRFLASRSMSRCQACLLKSYVPSGLRKHSVRVKLRMPDLSPCSRLPAPRLNRHIESPMPFGRPYLSFAVLNSQSAICRCCFMGQ